MCFILYAIACLDKLLIEEGNKKGEYISFFMLCILSFGEVHCKVFQQMSCVLVDFNLARNSIYFAFLFSSSMDACEELDLICIILY